MKKKLLFNSVISLLYQLLAVIVGLVLPRLFIKTYGSEVNGLVTSITQLLSIISLVDLGVGAVVQAALYKPLCDHDNNKISTIFFGAKRYFNIVALILIAYVAVLCGCLGFLKEDSFSPLFTITLILSIAISYFAQYFFGICDTLLLNADQRIYVVTISNIVCLIANAIISIILIYQGVSIQLVKLISSCIFLLKPLIMELYVRKKYVLTKPTTISRDAIPNKWSGLAQHVSVVVTNSVDNVVLTIFSTFSMVSVYNVYVMPLNSIRNLIEVTSTSYKSYFGNIIAKNDFEKLAEEFSKYESLIHFVAIIVFGTIIRVLTPFALVYTSGVADANYNNFMFAFMITIAYAVMAIRMPYTNMIFAAGKFKETQVYSIVECIINIALSVVLVNFLGLVGVAIGTVVSSGYRTIMSAYYLRKNVLNRSFWFFVKHILIDCLCLLLFFIPCYFIDVKMDNWFNWFGWSCMFFAINILISTIVFSLFFRKSFNIISIFKKIIRKKERR